MKILFVTGATHKKHMRNLNHFQRVYFLSRESDLSILALKKADFSLSANPGTTIYRSLFSHKIASLIYFVSWLLVRGRKDRFDLIITEPSLYSVCGFWARLVLRTKWVVDIWDIPIRNQSDRVLMRLKTRIERWIFKILFRFIYHNISIRYDILMRLTIFTALILLRFIECFITSQNFKTEKNIKI